MRSPLPHSELVVVQREAVFM